MKKNRLILLLVLFFLISFPTLSQAIIITATPNPASVGQNVSIIADVTAGQVPCTIFISYGDNTTTSFNCVQQCVNTSTHSYSSPGNYIITASSQGCATPPDPATFTLNILQQCQQLNFASPSALPSASVAQVYSYQLQTSGGQPPVTFNLVSGSLPPGLTLNASGLISGTPVSPGNYSFTVEAKDSCLPQSQSVQRTFSLNIIQQCPQLNFTSPSALPSATTGQAYSYQLQTSGGQPPVTFNLVSGSLPPGLTLNASGLISGTPVSPGNYSFTGEAKDSCIPQSQSVQRIFSLNVDAVPLSVALNLIPSFVNIPRNTASVVNVLYSFTSTPPSDVNLRSDKGVFLAGNSVIGEDPIPLTVSVFNGTGSVAEALNIPVAITKRAEALGTTRITYTRTFYNQSTQISGQMTLQITTEALAEFKINRLQLYFENMRAETTIKRNYPSLRAYADIRFTGSGFLRGYWEVDGRILSHVHMHLVYGRSITLETPEIPPLPTFDEGTHRLRLVITSPLLDIPVPEALYFVTAEDYKKAIVHIKLLSPDDADELDYKPVAFRWEGKDVTVVYLIEFFEGDDEKPMFSAYTKKAEYLVPSPIHEKLFGPDKKYRWKVKGFDTETNIIGESFMNRFIFK